MRLHLISLLLPLPLPRQQIFRPLLSTWARAQSRRGLQARMHPDVSSPLSWAQSKSKPHRLFEGISCLHNPRPHLFLCRSPETMDLEKHSHVKKDVYVGDECWAFADVLKISVPRDTGSALRDVRRCAGMPNDFKPFPWPIHSVSSKRASSTTSTSSPTFFATFSTTSLGSKRMMWVVAWLD